MSQASRGGIVKLPDPNKEQIAELQGVIARLEPEIAKALPKTMNADRMARIALTMIRQSDIQAIKDGKPENSLAVCDPMSFAGALLTASALGLEPGINGEAYLVPYKRECTLIVGYQGFAKLFWQHPLAHYLDAHAVHENDEFDYGYGLNQFLTHKPARGERGPVIAYWAAGQLATGASRFVVLSPDEVKKLRNGKVGPSGRIADPMLWMERKTALRQLLKLMPKSVTLDAAMRVDEQRGSVLSQRNVPQAIANELPLPELPAVEASEPAEDSRRVTGAEITNVVSGRQSGARATTDVSDAVEMISQRQSTKLHAALNSCGIAKRPDVLTTLGMMVGRTLGSSSELTAVEATSILDALDRCVSNENPAAALDFYLTNLDQTGGE